MNLPLEVKDETIERGKRCESIVDCISISIQDMSRIYTLRKCDTIDLEEGKKKNVRTVAARVLNLSEKKNS